MFATGDRIEMIRMSDDPNPIAPGTKGTVRHVEPVRLGPGDNFTQIDVLWDNGRTLMVVCPPDRIRKI
jgi:hypothetical protein